MIGQVAWGVCIKLKHDFWESTSPASKSKLSFFYHSQILHQLKNLLNGYSGLLLI